MLFFFPNRFAIGIFPSSITAGIQESVDPSNIEVKEKMLGVLPFVVETDIDKSDLVKEKRGLRRLQSANGTE